MARVFATDAERDAFLAESRLAILMTNRPDQAPMGVPVWFEWTGSEVQICEDEDAWPLVERIAPKYWDVQAKQDTLAEWEAGKEHLVLLRLKPGRIRSGQ